MLIEISDTYRGHVLNRVLAPGEHEVPDRVGEYLLANFAGPPFFCRRVEVVPAMVEAEPPAEANPALPEEVKPAYPEEAEIGVPEEAEVATPEEVKPALPAAAKVRKPRQPRQPRQPKAKP